VTYTGSITLTCSWGVRIAWFRELYGSDKLIRYSCRGDGDETTNDEKQQRKVRLEKG
jgi:hypothetical protein